MRRSGADADQFEFELARSVRWNELPQVCREQAVELLGQLLQAVARAERRGEEVNDER
jgi:hypothetical protein